MTASDGRGREGGKMAKIGCEISDAERWRVAEALRSVEDRPGHGKLTAIGLALYGDDYLKIPGQMALAAVCTRLAALIEPIKRPAYEELMETAGRLREDARNLAGFSSRFDGPLAIIAGETAGVLDGISLQIRDALRPGWSDAEGDAVNEAD